MKLRTHSLSLLFVVSATYASSLLASDRDPLSRETAIRQARPRLSDEKFDPQERNPRLQAAFKAADAGAERAVGNVRRDNQFILRFWSAKKKLLREKHGIDWKTPAELNPMIAYDSYGQPRITAREIREITPTVEKQMRRKHGKIKSVERTFDGTVYVWTDVGRYVVRRNEREWKIVHYDVVLPERRGEQNTGGKGVSP